MGEATDYENELSLKENQDDLAKIRASGRIDVRELSENEQAALRKALTPVQKEMEPRIGKTWIEAVQKETAVAAN